MLREQRRFLKTILVVTDLLLVTGALFVALEARGLFRGIYRWGSLPDLLFLVKSNFLLLPFLLSIFGFVFSFSGLYESFRRQTYFEVAWLVVSSVMVATGIFGVLGFLLGFDAVTANVILLFAALCVVLLCLSRFIVLMLLHRARKKGYNYRNVLVVGTNPRAVEFAKRLEHREEWGYRILGFVDNKPFNGEPLPHQILGRLEDIPRLIREQIVDLVAFVVPRSWLPEMGQYIRECETQGKEITVAIDLYSHQVGRVKIADLAGSPVLQFETTFLNRWQVFIKRMVDVIISSAMIIVLSPVMLAIAVLIKRVSPGPVFFRQERCGLNGRRFNLLKFRTMVVGAEAMLDELRERNESSGPTFKLKEDPRIIRYGRFLRRFSLDELPQLFNVLLGHMSLVGPRPPIPYEVQEYKDWQRRRLSVRPGITCLWQVGGRNEIGFEEWMNLDLQYIDKWSLWMDLKILLRTIPAVLLGTGK